MRREPSKQSVVKSRNTSIVGNTSKKRENNTEVRDKRSKDKSEAKNAESIYKEIKVARNSQMKFGRVPLKGFYKKEKHD